MRRLAVALVALGAWLGSAAAVVPAGAEAVEPGLPPGLISGETAIAISGETGAVLGRQAADKRRPMASTTKIMTALIAIEHTKLPAGHAKRKNLDDIIAVGSYPPQIQNLSFMRDIADKRLEQGERVTLRQLLYGLILRSGNDAAQVIAEHTVGCRSWDTEEGRRCRDLFADLMNARARQLGLQNTHYKNPHGLDAEGHYSSARDLANLSRFALRDPTFATIVRTSNYPEFKSRPAGGGEKTYRLRNLNRLMETYPGANGVKHGSTVGAGQVRVGSATLMGKSVVAVVMHSDREASEAASNDVKKLLDHGFGALLTMSASVDYGSEAGAVRALDMVCGAGGRVVTAVRDGAGRLRLVSWTASADGKVTRTGDSGTQGEALSEVASVHVGGKLATAIRDGSGKLKLITWSVGAGGALTRLSDSGATGPAGSQIALRGLSGGRALTAMRSSAGNLSLISWRLNADGSWSRLAESAGPGEPLHADTRIAMTGWATSGGPDVGPASTFRAITAVRDAAGNLKLIAWDIAADGAPARRGAWSAARAVSEIAIYYGPFGRVYTAVRNSAGNLELMSWDISTSGMAITLRYDADTQAGRASEIRVDGFTDSGLMTALRDGSGDLKLIAWALTQDGRIKRLDHQVAGTVTRLELCPQLGNRYLTAVTRPSEGNTLKLLSWRAAWKAD